MKKINILKTSYLKRKIKENILKICLLDFKLKERKIDNKKILIVSMDSLGDNVIKSKTIEILSNEFKKENIYILCKNKWKEIYDLQGYFNLFVDESNWNIFHKVKLYRKINKMNFSKVISLSHKGIAKELEYIYTKNKYATLETVDYVLERHVLILNKVLNKNFSLEEVKPNFKKYFPLKKYSNIICIGIGASGNERMMKIENMKKIIVGLLQNYPKKDILLFGNGKREKEYAKKISEGLETKNLKNYIDKLSILETMQYISDCDLFIGMDSGLMNIAFALDKKVICTHWSKEKYFWEHPFKNVKIVKGNEDKKYYDKVYGTEILNSISFEQIIKAAKELNVK